MTAGRVALACHDAGGARALLPVARHLESRGHELVALLSGPAATIFPVEGAGIPSRVLDDRSGVAQIAGVLSRERATALLSAAGLYNHLEHAARLAARLQKIPTVAVLDAWLNYGERFERADGAAVSRSWPDAICVPDYRAYEGMRRAGFAPRALILTGPPNLEASAARVALSADERAQRRRALEVGAGDVLAVFFSDPFFTGNDARPFTGPGGLAALDGTPIFGFTPPQILAKVLDEFERAAAGSARRCHVVMKPHPLENAGPLTAVLSREHRHVAAELRGESPAQLIEIADVVVGMMTIALLEASLSGVIALSVEIGLREFGVEDPCVSNLLGYTRGIYDDQGLRSAAETICRGELDTLRAVPAEPLALRGAASRVADVVERALSRVP